MAWLLDLDGVLLDSERIHKRAEQATLAAMGLEVETDDLENYTGVALDPMLADLHKRFGIRLDRQQFLEEHRPRLLTMLKDEMSLQPDAEQFLAWISAPCALVTNSMRWYVEPALDKFPLLRIVSNYVVCADDVQNTKPSPDGFLRASELIGVRPERAWAVEDSESGVEAARAAGCKVIGVRRGRKPQWSAVDIEVESLSELMDLHRRGAAVLYR